MVKVPVCLGFVYWAVDVTVEVIFFFFSSRRRHTRFDCDWSSDVCSSDLNPLTSAATMTEKIRRPNYGTLEVEITIDDSKAYTAPWTAKITQPIVLDSELDRKSVV